MHVSYEGGILEDPWAEPPENIFQMTVRPNAPKMKPSMLRLALKKVSRFR